MNEGRCRVCGGGLFARPLMVLRGMPKAAQFMPDERSLDSDRAADLKVCQCSGCGLVQLDSDPVPYYRDVIRASAVSAEMAAFRRWQFADLIQRFDLQGKKILEIGCGQGEFLSILHDFAVIPFGLEHAEASVRHCRAIGLDVHQGYLEKGASRLEGGPFDAFMLLMFLEHMPDPNGALREISENLVDGGLGLVEVPSFDMVLRNNLFSEFIGDHLLYFTRETLSATLNLNGYEVLSCDAVRYDYVLSAVVRKRRPTDVSPFAQAQERLRKELNRYIDQFGQRKVAVWGAGHQAFAVLALTGLAGRIRYVVDSAPFKQGKFTPATHIPIVPPEAMINDPVDAIIVIAGSYSDEVAGVIRRDCSPALSLAILRSTGLEIVTRVAP